MNPFKFENDPSTDSYVLKLMDKSFQCSRETASTANSSIPSFVDLCIGQTLSFISGNHIDESPKKNENSNILTPKFARTVTSNIDTPYPTSILQDSQVLTNKDELINSFQGAATYKNKNMCNDNADSGDYKAEAKYVEPLQRSRVSNISFKRKYKALDTKFREDSDILLKLAKRSMSKGLGSDDQMYDEKVDTIMKFMNTDKDHAMERVSDDSLQSKSITADMGNYSYYALFFMVMSNFIGFGLSLTFQMLLFMKANADRFLHRSWQHWKSAGSLHCDNNMLTLILLIPVLILVCCAYGFIWACFGINKFLLTAVPDRVANMINYNIRIVTK